MEKNDYRKKRCREEIWIRHLEEGTEAVYQTRRKVMNPQHRQEEDIKALYDHARVANEEMSVIRVDLAEVKTNVAWIMKFFWIVAT